MPEVDPSLYETIGEVITDETVEEVQQIAEADVEEIDGRFWCDPEANGCWAGRGVQVVTFIAIVAAIGAFVAFMIIYGEDTSAMSLLQSEVFNFSMQDYYQKVGMNLALEF